MRATPSAASLIWAAILILLTGCASQQSPPVDPDPFRSTAVSRPLLLASNGPVDLSPEEAALLEDDEELWEEEDDEEIYTVYDPLEGFNRAMFFVNDKLYFWLFKPVALGYRAVVPSPARTGVKNFFYNLAAPVRIVSNLVQGRGQATEAEITKFLYNTTVGVLGFGDPASKQHPMLDLDAEDLGQAMGRYGIGNGFYFVWPLLGPSTLRDSVGMLGDWLLNPLSDYSTTEINLALAGFSQINNLTFRIGDYETLKKAALDPYEAMRNAYIQLRQSRINQ